MNKQLAKKGTTLNKNMTNTVNLQVNDLTVTNLSIPIYVDPEEPENPKEGTVFLRHYAISNTFQLMLYFNGDWI